MRFAGCIGCGATGRVDIPWSHDENIWLRTEPYEQLGVCFHCRAFAMPFDFSEITAAHVLTARESLPLVEPVSEKEAEKIAARANHRIAWFSFNDAMEKPIS